MVDTHEYRDIAVVDIPSMYLYAKIDEFILLKIVNEQVDMISKIDRRYKEFVTIKRGRRVLYLILNKAMYRYLQSALLWYELFSITLIELGFKLNLYDLCIANANVKGS